LSEAFISPRPSFNDIERQHYGINPAYAPSHMGEA
jgi:hypothetical protein